MLTRANIINVVSTKTEPVDKVSKEGPAQGRPGLIRYYYRSLINVPHLSGSRLSKLY